MNQAIAAPDVRLEVPAHVPANLVWRGDFERFATAGEDPFERLGELHDGPDILWVRKFNRGMGGGRPGWLVTRHALMREILSDTDNFISGSPTNLLGAIGLDSPLIPLELDPPQQQRYRKVLEPFFSPASIDRLDRAIRKSCDQLLADFEASGSCEFITQFAEKFPSHVFLDLMGMPRTRLHDFLTWEREMLRGETPGHVAKAMASILAYLREFLCEQRAQPTSDLMRGIVNAKLDDGSALGEEEMLSVCYLLYIGGLDTVYGTLGWIFWHLAHDQPLQQRLRAHPEDQTRATEELLRAFSAASTARNVRQDLEFHGVTMRAGDSVSLYLSLAARDPQAYTDPHRVDIDRGPRHLAFGTGPHTCLGLRLAKREIRIVLEQFLARFRNIRMPAGERHRYHVGSVFGIDYLPLCWER